MSLRYSKGLSDNPSNFGIQLEGLQWVISEATFYSTNKKLISIIEIRAEYPYDGHQLYSIKRAVI